MLHFLTFQTKNYSSFKFKMRDPLNAFGDFSE